MTSVLFLLAILLSLGACDVDADKSEHNVRYYYRDEKGINEYYTFSDYLVISNYRDGLYTVQNLVEIARLYIDTVRSKKPVSGITFVGKRSRGTLPKGDWDHFTTKKSISL